MRTLSITYTVVHIRIQAHTLPSTHTVSTYTDLHMNCHAHTSSGTCTVRHMNYEAHTQSGTWMHDPAATSTHMAINCLMVR